MPTQNARAMGTAKEDEKLEPKKANDASSAAHCKAISPVVDFLAAGFVSSLSKIIVYPMETKVLLMAIGKDVALDPMRMWHGMWLKALENFSFNGLQWFLKERIRPPPPNPCYPEKRPPAAFHKAFIAACFVVLCHHPVSNVVVGMQASLQNPDQLPLSAAQVANAIMTERGIAGFFRGWQFSILLRIGMAMAIVVYDLLRVRCSGILGRDISNFSAAVIGRLCDVCSCHPFKTARTRYQQGKPVLNSWSFPAVFGLWSGMGLTALADAAKIGIRFLLIERTRMFLQWVSDRIHGHFRKRTVDLTKES